MYIKQGGVRGTQINDNQLYAISDLLDHPLIAEGQPGALSTETTDEENSKNFI